jgi:hypothetical protein
MSLSLRFSVENQPKLLERFEKICQQYPGVRVRVFLVQEKLCEPKKIQAQLVFLHDAKKHEGRKIASSGGDLQWLTRLTFWEVTMVNTIMSELAGSEFDVELCEMKDGIFIYHLV